MNFRQLKYFVQVVDSGNMTRAAQELNLAQPTLGMQIKQLEEELGIALLVRHSRGIDPTPAGRILYDRAIEILKLTEEARQQVVASGNRAFEPLRFGITPSVMQIVGPELALQMAHRAPEVLLSLSEEMSHLLIDALHRGGVDMILAYEVPDKAGYAKRALYQEDLVLVTSSRTHQDGPITFSDALKETLVLPESRDSVRTLVQQKARDLGLEMKIEHEIRSIPGLKTIIQRGLAAGILPYGTVMDEVKAGSLAVRPIVSPTLRRTLFLAGSRPAHRMRNLPAVLLVVEAAVATLATTMGPLGHLLPSGKAGALSFT
jgi:LysR family transcriptional regulator, nitrogen assimilation regulatory protein